VDDQEVSARSSPLSKVLRDSSENPAVVGELLAGHQQRVRPRTAASNTGNG
jgi:hypothetical protein